MNVKGGKCFSPSSLGVSVIFPNLKGRECYLPKILSIWILKTHTHTHTLNKSNQLTHVKPCDGQITLYLQMYQE